MDEPSEARLRAAFAAERASPGAPPDERWPVDVYRGGDWTAERDRLFGRVWLPVAHASAVATPGQWVAREVHGRPVVVVRGDDGALRAFRNLCVHRRAVVVRGDAGCARAGFTCPYHGVRYGLDGAVAAVPDGSVLPAAVATDRLPPIPVRVAAGFVFVAAGDDPPPFDAFLPEALRAELDVWSVADLVPIASRTWDGPFDWKLGVEAFIEPLHGPFLHPRTVAPFVNHRASAMDAFGDHCRMALAFRDPRLYRPDGLLGRAAAAAGVGLLPGLGPLHREANFVALLFPGWVVNLLPHHVTTIGFTPLGPRATRVSLALYAPPPATDAARAFWATVWPGHVRLVEEDLENLRWLQQGVDDPAAGPLRLSRYERQIGWFRAAVARWIVAGPTPGLTSAG
ncbi:MAG: aromatic ring-hydroxylating dioxygenase subunit alpha [Myxococcota bacterium]